MRRGIAYVIMGIAVGICGLGILLVVIYFGRDIVEFAEFTKDLNDDKKQMAADKKYMDSLTDKDMQAWIQRTQNYLKEDDSNGFPADERPVPPDLQKLGITGIEENTNEVGYIWFGGMDDTGLWVERMSNGDFEVFAVYTPYSNRMIWPKRQP